MMKATIRAFTLVPALLAALGCSGSPRTVELPEPVRTAPEQRDAAERARADSVRLPYTAADIHFMTMMIAHHAQAIEMARMAPTHAASPAVQTLAARIINSQQDEIGLMRQWLRDRNLPVPDPAAGGAHAGHGAGTQGPMMGGMLTHAQMMQLDAAREWEFDRLFLTFMIQHHRGAVAMVEQLFGTHGAAQDETVFRLASDVQVDQKTEIARMERMLVDLITVPESP